MNYRPPDLPGREATPGFSLPEWAQKKKTTFRLSSSVPPQGLEPWTPTLRVSCSTN